MTDSTQIFRTSAVFQYQDQSAIGELAEAVRGLDEHDRIAFYLGLADLIRSLPSYDHERVQAGLDARGYAGPDATEVMPVPSRHVTYYVRLGNRVKIGTTTHLANRLQHIPCEELLAVEPGGVDVERERHRQFQQLRVTGEWFEYAEPLISHVAQLA